MRGPLLPYNPAEAIGTEQAASRAGRSDRTIREWCSTHQIGRRICGRWAVSGPALEMLLAGDDEALEAYLLGDRLSECVRRYFRLLGIALGSTEAIDAPPAMPSSPLN